MKCLVTEGASQLGSILVGKLLEKGYEVVVWDTFSTNSKENRNPRASYYDIDIEKASPDQCKAKFDLFFHIDKDSKLDDFVLS